MNILVKINFDKKDSTKYADEAIGILVQNGHKCFTDLRDKENYDNPLMSYEKIRDILPKIDLIVVLGGDGTVLQSVGYALKADKPILGINIGRVGFLCQLEKEEIDKLSKIGDRDISYYERMLVEARHITK